MYQNTRATDSANSVWKAISLLLALALILGLTACGKDGNNGSGGGKDGDTQQLSGTVYAAEFIDLNAAVDKAISYIDGVCASGDYLYLLTTVYTETEQTDPETGETYTSTEGKTVILQVSPDGAVQELTNYEPLSIPEGMEGYSDARGLAAGAEGTLWVNETMNYYTYDLPEDFDPETDDQWNYMSEQTTVKTLRQLDTTGNEIQRVDISDLEEKLNPSDGSDSGGDVSVSYSYSYTSGILFDPAGNTYMLCGGKLWVLDGQMEPLFSLDAGDNAYRDPVVLGDGTVGLLVNYSDPVTNTYGYQLQTVDLEAQAWGATYALPSEVYEVYPGGGDYLCYYMEGDELYGGKPGDTDESGKASFNGQQLLNWLDSDINANNIQFFTFLSDGRVAVMTEDWSNDRENYELALLTEVERSTLPEKTTLTLGAMYLGYNERNKIVQFNRSSDKYRIEVVDYSQYNTDDDPSGGLSRFNTEVIAGNIPDILATDNMPISQLAGKDLLEDLWPYIDGDTELGGREALMQHVFDVASDEEGRLLQVFSNFSISTVAGATSVVGDRTSWTLADLQAALATMPEGCSIFSDTDSAPDMLTSVMAQNLNSFVDWDTGKCSFNTDEFKSLLQFCAGFPASFDWDSYQYDESNDEPTRISEGRQMLLQTEVYGFAEIQMHKAMFGGAVSYVGYPREDGSCGSAFTFSGGLAMSSTCKDKDGAWSYMRQVLLPDESVRYADRDESELSMGSVGNSSFSTNKADFDFIAKACMTPHYQTDANGDPVLDENGQPVEQSNYGYGWGNLQVDIMAASQEEYDQLMALYNAVDSIYEYDEKVFDIVSDTAGSYFAGDTDLDTAVNNIQSKVELYVNENR